MADLGILQTKTDFLSSTFVQTIGLNPVFESSTYVRITPTYLPDAIHADVSGTISGTVIEGVHPLPFSNVYLLWRSSMQVISSTKSDKDGKYAFTGLSKDSSNYLAIATREVGYNAIVWDFLTPK